MKKPLGWLAVFLASALPALAQDKGQWGFDLSAGSSSTVGATVHLTDRWALRPTLGFSHSTSDESAPFTTENAEGNIISIDGTQTATGTAWSPGLEALFYVSRHDAFSTYVAASYQYTHNSASNQFVPPPGVLPPNLVRLVAQEVQNGNYKSTSHGNGVGVAFGLQYALHKHFSVFGEVGVRYSDSSSSSGPVGGPNPSLDGKLISDFASALGVIFYLK
jgi:hypothetical protein